MLPIIITQKGVIINDFPQSRRIFGRMHNSFFENMCIFTKSPYKVLPIILRFPAFCKFSVRFFPLEYSNGIRTILFTEVKRQ